MDYDCRIVGGSIIDGTGAERFKADIGIKDGRIAAVGKAGGSLGGSLRGSAAQTIDAGGLVVAPGVIDVHTQFALGPFQGSPAYDHASDKPKF